MSKTIYICTKGDGSELEGYEIESVFDSKELAEKYQDMFSGINIEEWSLNPLEEQMKLGLKPFDIIMAISGEYKIEKSCNRWSEEIRDKRVIRFVQSRDFEGQVVIEVPMWALSQEEAVKIADNIRMELLTKGKWS